MKTNLKVLPKINNNSAKRLLEEALKADYDTVFFVGFKDNVYYPAHSRIDSVVAKLGCLELLKNFIINGENADSF